MSICLSSWLAVWLVDLHFLQTSQVILLEVSFTVHYYYLYVVILRYYLVVGITVLVGRGVDVDVDD